MIPALAITFTVSVQDAPGAKLTPVNEICVEVGTAVAVPPHALTSPLGLATVNPFGRSSVKLIAVKATLLGLVKLKVRATTPPGSTLAVANAFFNTGGSKFPLGTIRMPVPGAPGPPFVENGVTMFVLVPGVVAVTLTITWQVEPAAGATAKLTPVRVIVVDPTAAFTEPPQVLSRPFGLATCTPEGRLSVKLTPVSGTVLVTGFDRVMVRVVVSPTRMLGGLNTLVSTGGATTNRSADAGSDGLV